MTRYLISFDEGAMSFPEDELPDVAKATHAVAQEAQDAGVWVFGGGLKDHGEASVVATDGTVTDAPYPGEHEALGRIHGRRRALTRGGAGVGCQDRRRLPLRARGPRVPGRPGRLIDVDYPGVRICRDARDPKGGPIPAHLPWLRRTARHASAAVRKSLLQAH